MPTAQRDEARTPDGDEARGTIVFAESLRWMGVQWGKRSTLRALKRVGFAGRFVVWSWDPFWRAALILPTIAAPRFLEYQARRLARELMRIRRRRPRAPLHLIGYSAGGFLAVRALEILAGRAEVDSCILLAAAFSPRRDLRPTCGSVRGPMVITHSRLDAIVGLGTLLTGTGDREHTVSIGQAGYRGPRCERIVALGWRPSDVARGHLGGHFTAADVVLPAAGFCLQGSR
jgi:pimeloyl-ACP methyl ester carboxylesterase